MERIPLLLHACCGPCSLEPLRLLREEGFEPTICWTNPNIQPVAEHDLRLETLQAWARDVAHVKVIVAGDDREKWERGVAPHGFDREARCRACYALRLAESCRVAKEQGFTHICPRAYAYLEGLSSVLPYSYHAFSRAGDVSSELLWLPLLRRGGGHRAPRGTRRAKGGEGSARWIA